MKVRELKKDVKVLFSHIIGDGIMLADIKNDEKITAEIDKMLHDAITKRDEFIALINHPELREKGQSIKAYYNKIRTDVTDYFNNFYETLSKYLEETTEKANG